MSRKMIVCMVVALLGLSFVLATSAEGQGRGRGGRATQAPAVTHDESSHVEGTHEPGAGGHEVMEAEPGEETAGNNLSFPVIWADGVDKPVRGTFGAPNFVFTVPAADGTPVYPQQSENTWQAESLMLNDPEVEVSRIDWGDNLESVDWYTRSKVRVETVLIKDLANPMLAFEMKHVFGLGMDELWGTTGTTFGSPEATVYSHHARLTIQKINERDEVLNWEPSTGWYRTTPGDIPAVFNMAVYEAEDGPGFYSAEINVKGKVIFGYTWDPRSTDADAGVYRMTFSLDPLTTLNTSLRNAIIEIPVEEEVTLNQALAMLEDDDDGGSPGGGTAYVDSKNNLTYIDVAIHEREQGGGGGGGQGGPPDGRGGGPPTNRGGGGGHRR